MLIRTALLLLLPFLLGGDHPLTAADPVRKAVTSVCLVKSKYATLTYKTIPAEPRGRFGETASPAARILMEQAATQRMMQAELVIDAPVDIEGIRLEPGRYGIGVAGLHDGNFDIGIFEGRKIHKLPLVVNAAPFESPFISFTLTSMSSRRVALVFHAGKLCARAQVRVAWEKMGKEKGEKEKDEGEKEERADSGGR